MAPALSRIVTPIEITKRYERRARPPPSTPMWSLPEQEPWRSSRSDNWRPKIGAVRENQPLTAAARPAIAAIAGLARRCAHRDGTRCAVSAMPGRSYQRWWG